MKPVRVRTLQSTDAEALLTFELDNREWFERFIDARDAAFFTRYRASPTTLRLIYLTLPPEPGTHLSSKMLTEKK